MRLPVDSQGLNPTTPFLENSNHPLDWPTVLYHRFDPSQPASSNQNITSLDQHVSERFWRGSTNGFAQRGGGPKENSIETCDFESGSGVEICGIFWEAVVTYHRNSGLVWKKHVLDYKETLIRALLRRRSSI